MDSISRQLEVFETCSALSRLHTTSGSLGVVNADINGSYQGTGMSFAAQADVFGVVTPRERKGDPSGTTTWRTPV